MPSKSRPPRSRLRGAWVQATYNHVLVSKNYRFGDARLGSLAFSVPF